MLIITRKPGESFLIDNKRIKVKVLHSSDFNVRIGIEAPREIDIVREEILNKPKKGDKYVRESTKY